jgi:hypothetical protein
VPLGFPDFLAVGGTILLVGGQAETGQLFPVFGVFYFRGQAYIANELHFVFHCEHNEWFFAVP